MSFLPDAHCPRFDDEHYDLKDYAAATARWCTGCGDNAILAGVQRLCRDEQLPREKVVFVEPKLPGTQPA